MAEKTERSAHILGAGATIEGIGGIAAVVLAILGLVQILPIYMAAIATIVIGVGLMLEGATVASRYAYLTRGTEHAQAATQVGGGLSAEFIGGAAGIVLGVLALLGEMTLTLVAVSVLVYGAALVVGAGTTSHFRHVAVSPGEKTEAVQRAGNGLSAASGADVMVGVGAIVLGILALVGYSPLLLSLIALLAIGVAVLLSGTTLTARMASALRVRHH